MKYKETQNIMASYEDAGSQKFKKWTKREQMELAWAVPEQNLEAY